MLGTGALPSPVYGIFAGVVHPFVMAGLVPAISVPEAASSPIEVAGPSPAVTLEPGCGASASLASREKDAHHPICVGYAARCATTGWWANTLIRDTITASVAR